jgi:hypothetical protein
VRYWLRELAGWLLVGLGLYVFLICLALVLNDGPHIIEAGPLTFIGFILFRGGIHLLKVAVAARVCLHAQAAANVREAKGPRSKGRPVDLSVRARRWDP